LKHELMRQTLLLNELVRTGLDDLHLRHRNHWATTTTLYGRRRGEVLLTGNGYSVRLQQVQLLNLSQVQTVTGTIITGTDCHKYNYHGYRLSQVQVTTITSTYCHRFNYHR